eukprot:NP_492813.2 Uncharacterized protein CELE_B0205.5 [Caenorhabditis elegans]
MLNERMIEHVKSKLTKRGVKVWDKLASRVSFLFLEALNQLKKSLPM